MDLLIDNTALLKDNISKHYDDILTENETELLDKLEQEKKKKVTTAHKEGKRQLEHQKRVIQRRKNQAYQEKRSEKTTQLRNKKATLLKELEQKTIQTINQDQETLDNLKSHLRNIIKKSAPENTNIEVTGKTVQTLKAQTKNKNKKYVYTAEQVIKEQLKKYWSDIAPDIRL